MLQRALTALGWKEGEETGPSVGKGFAAVREANSSDEKKEMFLWERAGRLKAAGHSIVTIEWLGKVLASNSSIALGPNSPRNSASVTLPT